MIRPLRVLMGAVLIATVGAFAAGTQPVAAAATCTIDQLTTTAANDNFANVGPSISADGTEIAFESNQDHDGFNADGNQEIFHYDIDTEVFTQVTSTTAGGIVANRSPAIDGDGSTVFYVTTRNIGGDNSDLNQEVYRWIGGGMFSTTTIITDTASPIVNGSPSVNNAGDSIAFISDRDGNFELFRYRATGSSTTRLTTTSSGDSSEPHLTASGDRVTFSSTANIGGTNADGSLEIFVRDLNAGTTVALTRTAAASLSPAISNNGRRIAFVSSADFAGRNPDLSPELYMRETTAGTTTALTAAPDAGFGISGPRVNAAGTRVAFQSDQNYRGSNGDGSFEVYLRDFGATGQRITQVTSSAAGSGEVDIDAAGTHVVFTSRGNLTGANADGGREIFLATCSSPPPPVQCEGQLVTVDRARGELPTTAGDVIRGTAGNDTVAARGGNDRFCGLAGNDTFNGGPGADRALGGNGNDRLRGDAGNDRLVGEGGADTLNGGGGPDTCLGGPGTDTATQCSVRQGIP